MGLFDIYRSYQSYCHMLQPSFEKKSNVFNLLIEYEAASQKENVPFFEEAAFWSIAKCYFENQQPILALGAVENALLHHCKSLRFHIFKVILMLQTDNVKIAREIIESVQKILPDEALPKLFRADAFCLRDQPASAVNVLQEMLNAFEPEEKPMLSIWNKMFCNPVFANGTVFDALAEQAIRQPYNEEILEQVWLNVELLQNYKESLALHETILDRNPYSSLAWFNLGFAYLNLRREKDALEAFEYSFITNPEFESGYKQFISLSISMKSFRTAIVVQEEMMSRFGEEPESLVNLGACYLELGEGGVAKYLFEKALKLDPYFPDAYHKIGLVHHKYADFKSAVKWFRQACQYDKTREDFAFSLAEGLQALGKTEEALEFYWKAVEIEPFEQRTWAKVIRFYTNTQNFGESLEVIVQAMENCTARNELNYMLSANLFLAGDRKKGLRELKKAIRLDPSKKELFFEFAPTLTGDKKILQILAAT